MNRIFAKWFVSSRFAKSLAVLVFVAGMASMSLEFAASRIIIPVFGSSIYTWGSLIGVILTGLSLGYHIGGKLADKNPNFLKLCLVIFSAGLYIIYIPFMAPTITSSFIQFVSDSQYASLFAVFTLLMVPTFLLGIVSPYAIKLATRRLTELGNVSGNLYSLSTIGSIVGTFLTVFVLIPAFEINYIVFGLGMTLMFFSSLLGLARFPKILAVFAVVLLFFFPSINLSSVGTAMIHPIGTLVYEKETLYSHLDVIDRGNIRTLYLDGNIHSQMYKDKPEELVNTYTKYFHLGFLFNPNAKDILFIGGGGFSGPKNFLSTYSDIRIDVVEIDADVISAARDYFNLPVDNGSRLMIYNDDARNFLSKTEKEYDLVILDAFSKNYVPFHLLTLEYFQLLDKKLTSDSIIISNNIGSMTGDRSDIVRAVYKTISQVFPSVYVFPTENNSGNLQNIMLAAMKTPTEYSKDELRQRTSNNYDNHNSSTTLDDLDYLEHLYEAELETNDVPLLTDQFAPVEILINPVTNDPYNLENVPIKGSIGISWIENTNSIQLILLTIMAVVWIFYTKREWKRNEKSMSL